MKAVICTRRSAEQVEDEPLGQSARFVSAQVGAMRTHLTRGESEHLWLNVLLMVAAVVVAIGRPIGG